LLLYGLALAGSVSTEEPQAEKAAAPAAQAAGEEEGDAPPRPKPEVRARDLGPGVRRVINPDGTSTFVDDRLKDQTGEPEPTDAAAEGQQPQRAGESQPPLERAEFANDESQQAPAPDADGGAGVNPIVLLLAGAVVVLLLVLMVVVRRQSPSPPSNPEG
jgi:hypothetical protein